MSIKTFNLIREMAIKGLYDGISGQATRISLYSGADGAGNAISNITGKEFFNRTAHQISLKDDETFSIVLPTPVASVKIFDYEDDEILYSNLLTAKEFSVAGTFKLTSLNINSMAAQE